MCLSHFHYLKLVKVGAVGKASAKSYQDNFVIFLYYPLCLRFAECDSDTCRGCIAVFVKIYKYLLHWKVHALCHMLNNSYICLMRYDAVDIIYSKIRLFKYLNNGLFHNSDGKSEYVIALHCHVVVHCPVGSH